MTSLLALTSEDVSPFEEYFEEIVEKSLADASIQARETARVEVSGTPVEEFDAIYFNPEPKAAIYARVFLETLQEKNVRLNTSSTAFFITQKKNYLFKVLGERRVPIPATVTVSTEKGLTGVEDEIEFPAVAATYSGFGLEGTEEVNGKEELQSVAERSEHGTNLVLVHEKPPGEIFESLYIGGETVSVSVEGGAWKPRRQEDPSMNYHTLPSEKTEIIEKTAAAIGSDICRVRLKGETVIDVDSDPRLETFQNLSGKDVYRKVADILGGDSS